MRYTSKNSLEFILVIAFFLIYKIIAKPNIKSSYVILYRTNKIQLFMSILMLNLIIIFNVILVFGLPGPNIF